MKCEEAWNIIINKIKDSRIELSTVPKVNKTPLWFSATTDGDRIFISEAVVNRPSSRLSMQRKLKYSTFEKIYPLYLRRENGEQVSKEVASITVNSVYYYAVIKHLCQE
jgi:hypothetical protein